MLSNYSQLSNQYSEIRTKGDYFVFNFSFSFEKLKYFDKYLI